MIDIEHAEELRGLAVIELELFGVVVGELIPGDPAVAGPRVDLIMVLCPAEKAAETVERRTREEEKVVA